MAISQSGVFELRATGSDENGGGFNPTRDPVNGIDRSQSDTPFISSTATLTGSQNVNPSGHTVTEADLGNFVNITSIVSGSASIGVYEISAVNVGANTWNLDRNTGTAGAVVNFKMGGALKTIGFLGACINTGHKAWIKSGAYSVTSSTINVANGCFSTSVGVVLEGYETTRGDLGAKPVITASGISSFTVITTGARSTIWNIEIDCAGLTSSRAFFCRGGAYRLVAKNCTNGGLVSNTVGDWYACVATGCSTQPAFQSVTNGASFVDCVAYANSVTGFSLNSNAPKAIRCISFNNTGSTSDGFAAGNVQNGLINCVAYGNGRDGFRLGEGGNILINCIAENNAGYGFNNNGSNSYSALLMNCAAYNNTSGAVSDFGALRAATQVNFVNGTTSFFIDAPTDFTLNNQPGGGAELRSASNNMPHGATSYLDVGAIQHQTDVTDEEIAQAVWEYAERTLTS